MMKESLAARQAALLRQNAELDQKVEAIEQRRQQQLQTTKSASGSSANLTKHHELTPAEPTFGGVRSDDGDHGSLDGDVSDAMSSPERATSPASRRGLAVDLSASIGATPSELQKKEHHTDGSKRGMVRSKSQLKRDKSLGNVNGSSDSARKPLRRYKTGLPRDTFDDHTPSDLSTGAKRADPKDPIDGGDDGMGLEATVRYQKARLRVLQDELDVARSEVKDMHSAQQQLKATIEELADENMSLRKKQQHTQLLLEKQQELSVAQESKQKILDTQLSTAQTKMDELQKAEKQASQQFRSKDVRLNRALEELEKVKAQLQEERRSQGDQTVTKAEHEQVLKENKRLEKQKNELLLAFKKQMKLIDLLKRQRIHMEAAKMLSFTEEEFSKTLELG